MTVKFESTVRRQPGYALLGKIQSKKLVGLIGKDVVVVVKEKIKPGKPVKKRHEKGSREYKRKKGIAMARQSSFFPAGEKRGQGRAFKKS